MSERMKKMGAFNPSRLHLGHQCQGRTNADMSDDAVVGVVDACRVAAALRNKNKEAGNGDTKS